MVLRHLIRTSYWLRIIGLLFRILIVDRLFSRILSTDVEEIYIFLPVKNKILFYPSRNKWRVAWTRVDLYQNWLEWFLSTLSFSLLIQMFRKTSDSLTTVGFTHSTPTQLKRTTSWASNAAKNYWYWRGEMRPRRNGGGPGTTARRLGTYREIYLG